MPVAIEMTFRGATLDQYDQILELMGFTDAIGPAGSLYHWVAKTDDGIRVVDVWESNERYDSFAQEKIGPFSAQVGFAGPPEIVRYEIHNTLVGPGVLAQAV